MPTRDELVGLSRRALREVLEAGHAIDPAALDDTEYHGIALAMPGIVRAFTWTKFFKVFHRRDDGKLVGWNCVAEQTPLDEPWVLKRGRSGAPKTYWHYHVVDAAGVRMPYKAEQGLLIDYGPGGNPFWDTIGWVKDPLLAVNEGDPSLLIGVSYASVGPLVVHTPTYFLLERGGPLSHRA